MLAAFLQAVAKNVFMHIKNYEFKARVVHLHEYEQRLLACSPQFKGTDHQIDTYFNVPKGRLKLREGIIENALIQYNRENTADAKLSDIILYKHEPDKALKEILTHQLGVKVIVNKYRRIYFIDNIKFHFDQVEHLGTFIEVEAIDDSGTIGLEKLKEQCDYYFHFFGLKTTQLIDTSYSDLLMERQN